MLIISFLDSVRYFLAFVIVDREGGAQPMFPERGWHIDGKFAFISIN